MNDVCLYQQNVGGARRKVRRSPVNSSTLVSDSQQPQATEDQDDDVDLALIQMPLSCQSILKVRWVHVNLLVRMMTSLKISRGKYRNFAPILRMHILCIEMN